MEILLLVFGLVLFVALVVVHEWGHFIMARRNGVEVEEFGIGFPPKVAVIKKDTKGTEYTINLLPLGGFVRLKGEHDQDKVKGSFGAASFMAKTKIILAGVAMNLFVAWLILTILALIGIPKLPLPSGEQQYTVPSDTKVVSNKVYVGYVEPGGPADKAGIKPGDRLYSIRPNNVDTFIYTEKASEIRTKTEEFVVAGASSLGVLYERNGQRILTDITPRSVQEVKESIEGKSPKGYLGIVPQDFTIQRSTWSAPIVGVGLVGQFAKLTYSSLGSAIANLFRGNTGQASENVSGPIGIFVVLKEGAFLGVRYILLIVALLSLTLAIMNTLPIPALDGGKLAVMGLFRLFKKPLTPSLEERIHGTGFMALMVLFVLITIVDVRRFF